PANGVDAREMCRRLRQGIHDPVEVILRVWLVVGIPDRLVAEHHAPVDDGCDLPVAAAKIEADATALQMTAERLGHGVFRREMPRAHDLQLTIEDELADEVGVESAGLGLTVMTRQSRRQRFRTVDVDAPAA